MGNSVSVPFAGYIANPVEEGSYVTITGRTDPDFKECTFNLCSGSSILTSDIILHIKFNYTQLECWRNYRKGNSWGIPTIRKDCPLKPGKPFTLQIDVAPKEFKIAVHEKDFVGFPQRMPLKNIQYLCIEGDIKIESIKSKDLEIPGPAFTPGYPFPQPGYPAMPGYPPQPGYPPIPGYPPQPGYPAATPGNPMTGSPVFNPPVPFQSSISEMKSGKIIHITGVPHPNYNRFTVNLMCGSQDTSDIALHIDSRFNYGSDRNVVIRNHKQSGKFGKEEKQQAYFPFVPGVQFDMMISTESECFQIKVNNQTFTEFKHRIKPLGKITFIKIDGDVTLTQVWL